MVNFFCNNAQGLFVEGKQGANITPFHLVKAFRDILRVSIFYISRESMWSELFFQCMNLSYILEKLSGTHGIVGVFSGLIDPGVGFCLNSGGSSWAMFFLSATSIQRHQLHPFYILPMIGKTLHRTPPQSPPLKTVRYEKIGTYHNVAIVQRYIKKVF